jgi:5-methylcytosine-specific restriction endonuclease McrA
MSLTRNYSPSIYGKPDKKKRLKKHRAAKKALEKLVLQDKVVQGILNKEIAKIYARKNKSNGKYPPYIPGMKSSEFYRTKEWIEARYKTLVKYGKVCQCCGAKATILHVDHIKPRSKYPDLELSLDNLQVLCEACNIGKSNKDVTDWR